MFAWWGRTVYRYRYIVIGVMVALCLGGGVFGISLGKHVTQSGFYDDGSQSVKASVLGDKVYGRDRTGHIVAIFTAPDGKTVDDPAWRRRSSTSSTSSRTTIPTRSWAGPATWRRRTAPNADIKGMATEDKKHTFVTIPLKGNDDDTILNNYKAIAPDLQKLDGGTVQLAGLEPVANAFDRHHRHRPEAHGSSGAAAGGGGAVPGVRRRGRGRPAGDSGRAEHRRRAGHLAARRRLRTGALLRPAGGVADRSGYRDRLRPFHGEPVPGGDRRGLRHRGRGATHGHDGRSHRDVLGGPDHRVERQPAGVARRAS